MPACSSPGKGAPVGSSRWLGLRGERDGVRLDGARRPPRDPPCGERAGDCSLVALEIPLLSWAGARTDRLGPISSPTDCPRAASAFSTVGGRPPRGTVHERSARLDWDADTLADWLLAGTGLADLKQLDKRGASKVIERLQEELRAIESATC